MSEETHGCGCCGAAIPKGEDFCVRCEGHVDPDVSKPPARRTYLKVNRVSCPFQDPALNIADGILAGVPRG